MLQTLRQAIGGKERYGQCEPAIHQVFSDESRHDCLSVTYETEYGEVTIQYRELRGDGYFNICGEVESMPVERRTALRQTGLERTDNGPNFVVFRSEATRPGEVYATLCELRAIVAGDHRRRTGLYTYAAAKPPLQTAKSILSRVS